MLTAKAALPGLGGVGHHPPDVYIEPTSWGTDHSHYGDHPLLPPAIALLPDSLLTARMALTDPHKVVYNQKELHFASVALSPERILMNRSYAKKPALFDIMLSILVDPRGTTNRLFRGSSRPPWVLTTFLLFMSICVAPPLVLIAPESTDPFPLRRVVAVVVGVLFTALASTFFMSMGLRSLNTRGKAFSIFAALVYATAPIVSMMIAALVTNRLLEGSLSLVSFLASGVGSQDDLIVTLFPHLIHLSLIGSFITLAHSLRALSRSSLSVALLMAIGSVPLILGSFVVGLTATELLIPNSSAETISLFRALFQLSM